MKKVLFFRIFHSRFVFVISCLHLIIFSLQGYSNQDSLKQLLKNADEEERPNLLFQLSRIYYSLDSFNLSLDYGNKCVVSAEKNDNDLLYLKAKNQIGYIYLSWDDYEKALDNFMSSLNLSQTMNNKYNILAACHGIGRTYTKLKDYTSAAEYLNKSLELAIMLEDRNAEAILNNALGYLYQETKRYDLSFDHYNKFHSITIELKDIINEIYALNNLGYLYYLMGDYEIAIHYLNLAVSKNSEYNNAQAEAASLGNLGEVYFKLGQYELAVEYSNKSLEISRQHGFRIFTADNYKLLSEIYNELGNYKLAYENFINYYTLHDSILSGKRIRIYKSLASRQKEQDEIRIDILEQQSRTRGVILYFTITISILGIIIITLLYIYFKMRIKLHKKEKRKLDNTIEIRNRELVTRMLDSEKKQQFLEEVSSSLDELIDLKISEMPELIDKLKHKIKSRTTQSSDWDSFKKHFEEVHPNFFKKLQKKHPSLTQYDLKQSGYIKINLTTKDIAKLLNISDRSVQTARYRIKKKLELKAEVDLIQYIQQI